MYPLDKPDERVCPNPDCRLPRYCNEALIEAAREDIDRDSDMPLPPLLAARQISYTSIGKALTEIWVDDSRRAMLSYCNEFFTQYRDEVNYYRDFFSGTTYKDLRVKLEGELDDNTICLVIFVDGYQLKNMQKAHQVMINCLIMNIHPDHR